MDIRSWVSDNAMKLLGMSESTIVDFLIATAQKASSPEDLYNKLIGAAAKADDDTRQFALELFGRVPRKQKAGAAAAAAAAQKAQRKERQKEEAELRKANKAFKLVLDEPDDAIHAARDEEAINLRKQEKKLRSKKKRKLEELSDDEDDTEKMRRLQRKKKKHKLNLND
ncbi:hypothetical protein BDF20DRAFT_434877 [Mycotypha africana]|uniref:uncharacterized protein n=1 Tax=Mycotypha africana TaxID=64632 RepID=UPI0023009977|nr:uncharacterized protein BDF20DRAFT_434877 [Mycotypha africana]KAI8981882.1 hypothetical protein BDF20DRAFT_434877 [Mycotypha africana]